MGFSIPRIRKPIHAAVIQDLWATLFNKENGNYALKMFAPFQNLAH